MTSSQGHREQTGFLIEPPQPFPQVLRDTCRVIQHHTEHRVHCFGDGGDVPTLWSPITCMEACRPNLPSLTWAPAPSGASSSLPPTKETPTLLTLALSCLPLALPVLWPPDAPSMSPQDIPRSPPSTQAPLCLLPLRRIIFGSWPTFLLGFPQGPTLDPRSLLSRKGHQITETQRLLTHRNLPSGGSPNGTDGLYLLDFPWRTCARLEGPGCTCPLEFQKD